MPSLTAEDLVTISRVSGLFWVHSRAAASVFVVLRV